MQDFKQIAKDLIEENLAKGTSPDRMIRKYASIHNLNDEQQQRIVEEYNVGRSLKSMELKDPNRQFEIASPIKKIAKSIATVDNVRLKKEAQLEKKANWKEAITLDMYDISCLTKKGSIPRTSSSYRKVKDIIVKGSGAGIKIIKENPKEIIVLGEAILKEQKRESTRKRRRLLGDSTKEI